MPIQKLAGGAPEIYTRFAAGLAAGGDPEPAEVEALLAKLRADLVREIKRRSLWHLPPSYLGLHGHRAWTDAGSARGSGPLDELLLDAFTALFVERLPTLAGYLCAGSSVDALVPHMLRNFVHDAQAKNDRLGIRLFRLLCAAVRQAEEEGRVEIIGGDTRIASSTVLAVAGSGEDLPEDERREHLETAVARWNDELLAALVAAPNRRIPALVARLAELLGELGRGGLTTFRFGELTGAVRRDARRRWAALFDTALGEVAFEDEEEPEAWGALCRTVLPEAEERVMAEDHFRHLIDCVARHIETMAAPERTRDHLFRLWGFLRAFSTEEAAGSAERLPSRRSLARFLDLPRDRFAELLATLGRFLTHCQSAGALEGGVA